MKDKESLHELIERYLDGDLSETEQEDVEHLLATDAGFRAELELQRAMQEHLGDPGQLRLRAALANMWTEMTIKQPVPDQNSSPGFTVWRRFASLAAAVLILLVAGWWWWNSSPEAPEQPVAEKSESSPQEQINATTPEAEFRPEIENTKIGPETAVPNPIERKPERQPVAMADPAYFAPNPTLEARIGGMRGDNPVNVELQRPMPDAVYYPDKNNKIALEVQAIVQADSMVNQLPIEIFIYSNRTDAWESKQPVFERSVLLSPDGEDAFRVDTRQQLRLRPGLYYLIVGQQRTAAVDSGFQTLYVSRFTVSADRRQK